MNLSNELFRSDEELIEKENNSKEPLKMVPHVYHLRYKCDCIKNENDFSEHKFKCENSDSIFFKKKKKEKHVTYNICCCIKDNEIPNHNLDDIFKLSFNENYKAILIPENFLDIIL